MQNLETTLKLFSLIKETIGKDDLLEGVNNLNDFIDTVYFIFWEIENTDDVNWVELYELVEVNDF
jgi:hypothetical protein